MRPCARAKRNWALDWALRAGLLRDKASPPELLAQRRRIGVHDGIHAHGPCALYILNEIVDEKVRLSGQPRVPHGDPVNLGVWLLHTALVACQAAVEQARLQSETKCVSSMGDRVGHLRRQSVAERTGASPSGWQVAG